MIFSGGQRYCFYPNPMLAYCSKKCVQKPTI